MPGTGSSLGLGMDNGDGAGIWESVRTSTLSDFKHLSGSKTRSCDESSGRKLCLSLTHRVKSWLQNVNVLKILLETNFKRNLPWQSVVNHANVCGSRVNKTNSWENNESKWMMSNSMIVRCVFPASRKGLSLVISLTPPSINCLDV